MCRSQDLVENPNGKGPNGICNSLAVNRTYIKTLVLFNNCYMFRSTFGTILRQFR
jgi:hypothetical protein